MVVREENSIRSENIPVDYAIIKKLKRYVRNQKFSYDLSSQIFQENILDKVYVKADTIPVDIFVKELGAFEAIVKYLKENLYLEFIEISILTERNTKTIWTAYNKSTTKKPEKFGIKEKPLQIPINIFKNRKLGVQENIVVYLKDTIGMSYHDIAVALKRNDRTIWTSYNRAKKKIERMKNKHD